MKKTLTFISFLALAVLVVFSNASAQPGIRTVKGDFYNITRTVEQTADSITFIADTLTFEDGGGATQVGNFAVNDSVVIFFVHNRFKIVNNWLQTQPQRFDYIYASVANSGALLGRKLYNYAGGVTDAAQSGVQKVGIRPIYRPLGNIAISSDISTLGPAAQYGTGGIRQVLSFYFTSLDPNESIANPVMDRIQVKNIYFKPNLNNLTGLASPPDTTRDILRAYHLDAASGKVVNGGPLSPGWTDLAVVRLLPGTTRYLVFVKDSAQAVDAGEYIGSFGDYSRGRFFLGDDGLPLNDLANGNPAYRAGFRPSQTRFFEESGLTVANPDYGMMVDGLPPERNPIKLSGLYQLLSPGGMIGSMAYPNQNPVWGLIPPYRIDAYAAPANYPYQPGLVTSGVDTLRFIDEWGNRTWDRTTQPVLKALSYTRTTNTIDDFTGYLKGFTAADDTLRQYGQIVYRRLAYTFARHRVNVGGVLDSIRIVAEAQVEYRGLGNIVNYLTASPDTSGGFPRKFGIAVRPNESDLDNVQPKNGVDLNAPNGNPLGGPIEPYRTPLDPLGPGMSLPNTGLKIVLRPNIPRHIDINTDDTWRSRNQDKDFLNIGITLYDGYGNEVDDNEKYKMELSPFGKLLSGNNYIRNGVFDSLVVENPNVLVSGLNLDTGRVFVNMGNLARAQRVFRNAGQGAYRIRIRSTWALNDRSADLHDPYKIDPYPTGNPSDPSIFSHVNNIPDGSPNNNFGYVYPNTFPITGTFYNPGNMMGQTTAFDSTDVIWDGSDWQFTTQKQVRVEIVLGLNDALVVGRVGGFVQPGQRQSVYNKLFVRVTDVQGNPKDITPYFDATNIANSKVFVELPDNPLYLGLGGNKEFFGSVSPNIAGIPTNPPSIPCPYNLPCNGPGSASNPPNIPSPQVPDGYSTTNVPPDPYNTGDILNAEFVSAVNLGFGWVLPGINGDAPALSQYKAVRFYLRAPKNVRQLGLDGTDKIRMQAHLVVATMPNVQDFSISSALAEMSIIPDVVQTVEIFHSEGKPQGTTVPMEGWNPMSTNDALNLGYPTGTPATEADSKALYSGYFFRARQPQGNEAPRQTSETFPVPITPEAFIGSLMAGSQSLDDDCTAPIPMDEVTVSENTKQVRLIVRVLDQFRNPVGARNVKFHIENETLPITPDLDANGKRVPFRLTSNGQYGAFGTVRFDPATSTYYTTNVQNDTVKRSTIGDTLTAGWVTAYYNSGFVGHQIVRIAVTPDTMAWDLSNIGRNTGEGTIVGASFRGFAPRVLIPIYLRPDTVAERVEIFPYTASSLSPIPLPVDQVQMAAIEDISIYGDAKQGRRASDGTFPCPNQDPGCYRDDPNTNYAPSFSTFSANPKFIETRVTHFGRKANTNIRPYIPDTLNLANTDVTNPNTITAGRIITLLARKYDKYGNLIGSTRLAEGQATVIPPEDSARIRFRMWAEGKAGLPIPYQQGLADGQFVPAFDWTRDEYGPMRKARYRHTIISNRVHESAGKGGGNGVFINQTAYCSALEFPTPKLSDATLYFEATAVSVIGQPNTLDPLPRDTVKIVSKMKTPTRYDILRGGQEYLRGFDTKLYTGIPEARGPVNPPVYIVGLPAGEDDPQQFNVDANGVDHLLLSQVYKYNVNNYRVGKYECVDVNNVPLDKNGNALYDATGAINPAFDVNPYSGLPNIHKFSAKNFSAATVNSPLPGEIVPPGARSGTYVCHVAGGGDGIGINIAPADRRPILMRITPIWENNPAQSGGAPYGLTMFTGANSQPGQTMVYEARLYADTVYTWTGYRSAPLTKANMTRIEIMGTRDDRAPLGGYTQLDRITRLGIYNWLQPEWAVEGLPCATNVLTDRFFVAPTPNLFANYVIGGQNATKFAGDYNRRYFNATQLYSRGVQSTTPNAFRQTISPGFFFKIVDSTSDQVLDIRIVDASLRDMAGNVVDDTISYDQGKTLVVRRENRNQRLLWHLDDTYKDQSNPAGGIQGPNYSTSSVSETPYDKRPPSQVTPIQPDEAAIAMGGFGPSVNTPTTHTVVVVPYRIAFTSIFPSSFDVSQGLFDNTKLPLGILPVQTDIDTLPRINLGYYQNPQQTPINQFELFTRLYGQIVHGATDTDPYNQLAKQPYARPDTVYRDITYTYAITPYDRYGNLNTRDSMFVSVGARFTDWQFLDLQSSGGDAYLLIRAGGQYLRCMPINSPTNNQYRQDTIRLFNPLNILGTNRNAWLGIKPDDRRIGEVVGESAGNSGIVDGLIPANIIASRPVWVKKAFAPAPFTLNYGSSSNTWNNPTLFRIDYTGDCDGKGNPSYGNNILHLKWRSAVWSSPAGNNNPNDTIRYEWNALIDSMGTSRRVSYMADNNGYDTTLTIGGDKIIDLIYRLNTTYQPNPDSLVVRVNWFVRAFSKTGLETFSDTAGATVRNLPYSAQEPLVISINRIPKNTPNRVKPPDAPPAINATSTLDVEWTQAADINLEDGDLIGGFKVYDKNTLSWQTDPGRKVDSLWYQWVGIVDHTVPAGKGVAPGTVVVQTMANPFQNGFTLDAATLTNLFKGFDPNPASESADSVIIKWYVYTKDFGGNEVPFPYNDDGTLRTDVDRYKAGGCQPHVITSGPYWLRLTKLEKGGVEIDEAAIAGNPNVQLNVGDQKCFTLTAKDKNNNLIRDWNVPSVGMATTITFKNSGANTDTSAVSWDADPTHFTWADLVGKRSDGTIVPLTKISDNVYSVPQDLFENGIAIICFTDTKSEKDVYLEVTTPAPYNTAKQNSVHMDFKEIGITNYLVEITSAVPGDKNKVYKERKYEIVVTPRDRYLNTSFEEIRSRFTARFPGEFDNSLPNLSDIFSGDIFVKANTNINFYLASRIARIPANQLQRITVISASDPTVRGESDEYQILDHAPQAFNLITPADQTHLGLQAAANPQSFTWQQSVDPYENVQISPRFNPTEIGNDIVKYEIQFVDSVSLAKVVKYDSYNLGIENHFETNQGQLADVINQLAGSTSAKSINVFWHVEATDGLYTTMSSPFTALRPGFSLFLDKQGILAVDNQNVPAEFTLGQNYPNPFNPTTSITYALPKQTQVSIVVFDLLGTQVKTLVNRSQAAGTYSVAWDATNDLGVQMPSGTYIYKIIAGDFTQTRKMTLMK